MEIVQLVFYFLLGLLALGVGIYFIFSPFALIIGLFNPRIVLDDKKQQTRMRVLKRYGVTSVIIVGIGLGTLSSATAEDSAYRTDYSVSSTTSSYAPKIQETTLASTPVETETWINVRGNRAVQVDSIETIDRIAPNNSFFKPVEAQGGQLVMVELKIKNTGQESGSMAWSNYQLIDSLGRKYDEINDFSETLTIKEWLKGNGREESSNQLFPGQIIEAVKIFRVASDAADFKLTVNGKRIDIN